MPTEGTATLTPPLESAPLKEKRHLIDKNALQDRMHEVRERAHDLVERNKGRVQAWEGSLEDYVREHPVQSVAIAAGAGAGIGLLFGLLLMRR